MPTELVEKCKTLLNAYKNGELGECVMPEDSNPGFSASNKELRLAYFTLPMALNYQRDSYKLWQSALQTIKDPKTKNVFSIDSSAKMTESELRTKLIRYKVALQPNKHVHTWKTLSTTIYTNWGNISSLFAAANNDFLILKELVQNKYKQSFPYLSGPKIFNYWSFIMMEYGQVPLKNAEFIEIAPDTHIIKCSILLGVISQKESTIITRDEISKRWRDLLHGSGISPIQMHPPLWFWSRSGFNYKL